MVLKMLAHSQNTTGYKNPDHQQMLITGDENIYGGMNIVRQANIS
jgi:hypothetical protein